MRGIEELAIDKDLNIYPNPSNNIITISSEESLSSATIRLTDLRGQTVIEKGIQAGETVVTDGQLRLSPGTAVTVKNAGSTTNAP